MKRRFKSEIYEFLWAIGFTVVFIFIGTLLKNFFYESVVPLNYPDVEPEEWAEAFSRIFLYSSIWCGIFNGIAIVLIGGLTRWNTKMAWLTYAIFNIISMLWGPIYLLVNYPCDMLTTLLVFVLFLFEYSIVFVGSTWLGPKGFCPFKSTKIRRKK